MQPEKTEQKTKGGIIISDTLKKNLNGVLLYLPARVKKTNRYGITHKHDKNAGSGGFNQGSKQDPDFDKGTKVSDDEKKTGKSPSNFGKQKENPKDGNMGKNNAESNE